MRYPRKGHTERFWEDHDKQTYTCPGCGRGIDEVDGFQVHHKDGHPSNGSDDNMTALCRECHWEEHGIEPGKHRGHWSEEYFHEWRSNESPLKYL